MSRAAEILLFRPAAVLERGLVAFCCAVLYLWHRLSKPLFGERCRFYPSCSVYAVESLRKHGLFTGLRLTAGRLMRCHPFASGGVDLVPEGRKSKALQSCCRELEAPTE